MSSIGELMEVDYDSILVLSGEQTLREGRVDLIGEGKDLTLMEESIAHRGLRQPIHVTRHPERDGVYVLEDGAQRLTCIGRLGWEKVPVLVKEDVPANDAERIIGQADANRRITMKTSEWIDAFKKVDKQSVIDGNGSLSADQLAKIFHVSPGFVTKTFSLNKLPESFLKEWVDTGKVAAARAQILAKYIDKVKPEQFELLVNQVTAGNDLEDVVREAQGYARITNQWKQAHPELQPPPYKLRPKDEAIKLLARYAQVAEESDDPFTKGIAEGFRIMLRVDAATLKAKADADAATKANKAAAKAAKEAAAKEAESETDDEDVTE